MYWPFVAAIGAALVGFGAPSWAALLCGIVFALAWRRDPPGKALKKLTTIALQLGVIALGAGMHLDVVLRTGLDGALITATSLTLAIVVGLGIGAWLEVTGDTPLLISVGTAICGGSAIAAVASGDDAQGSRRRGCHDATHARRDVDARRAEHDVGVQGRQARANAAVVARAARCGEAARWMARIYRARGRTGTGTSPAKRVTP